jgi:hypothetical protein
MKPLRDQLLTLCDAYCEAKKLSRSRASTLIFNGGHVIDRVANGGDVTTGNFEKALVWFSRNWPEGAAWPTDVSRPFVAPDPASSPEAAA